MLAGKKARSRSQKRNLRKSKSSVRQQRRKSRSQKKSTTRSRKRRSTKRRQRGGSGSTAPGWDRRMLIVVYITTTRRYVMRLAALGTRAGYVARSKLISFFSFFRLFSSGLLSTQSFLSRLSAFSYFSRAT